MSDAPMTISLIAAVARNGTIGRDGDLPWRIKDDMRFFMETTQGHFVITGRLNFEAMGKPLPKRDNVVVTRRDDWSAPGAHRVASVEEGLMLAEDHGEGEAFIIGGAQIYRLGLPYAHKFYRTRVLADVPGHVFFPPFDEGEWQVTELDRHDSDENNEHPFIIEELTRLNPPRPFRR